MGVEDTTCLEVESLVAVHVADCPPPSIGRVKEIKGSQIEVAWLKGAYNKDWQPWMVEDPQDKRKKVPWTDWVSRNSILLFDFHLTKTQHLKKETVTCLKTMYDNLNM